MEPTTPPQPTPPTPPATADTPTSTTIEYADFAKIELRVATIVEAKVHSNADKLLVIQVELADGQRRQICAGIRSHYSPEQLVGKQVIVVANLAPRPLRGEVSQGMLLAATDSATRNIVIVSPSQPVAAGSGVK